ncbi:MAG: Glu-tRNA(Gln) amidotransferase subunit GatD [Candidatus Aenigmarchaeota archaeon]|nr:Glu-tRNA(Gln) amidotransferase subunit GatD [Candidatus Aenigmarchaeota archaeon]
MYSKEIRELLEKKGVEVGNKVKVTKNEETYEGILMPRIEMGDPNSLIIKLENGYNIGLEFDDMVKIKKLGEGPKLGIVPELRVKREKKLPDVSMIATGGTIGTHVDYKTGGVYMCRSPEQILSTAPEIGTIIDLKNTFRPFTLASEDLTYNEWKKMARLIANELNSGCHGVIVTHGTDILHYSAAAMSFMLRNLTKPVAFVGAQRSPDRGSFDGSMNLICASHFTGYSDVGEVCLVMHGSSNDDHCLVHRGTRVRKFHTSRRDAFQSVNEKPLMKVWKNGKMEKVGVKYEKFDDRKVEVDDKWEPKVALIKAAPNSDPSIINWYIDKKYKGLVLEGFGLGHVPTSTLKKEDSWLPMIKKAIEEGISVVMTSQTIFGRVHPYVYRNLRMVSELGTIYAEDMLTEVTLVKLSWVLGHTKEKEKVKEMMLTSYAHEITPRTPLDSTVKTIE